MMLLQERVTDRVILADNILLCGVDGYSRRRSLLTRLSVPNHPLDFKSMIRYSEWNMPTARGIYVLEAVIKVVAFDEYIVFYVSIMDHKGGTICVSSVGYPIDKFRAALVKEKEVVLVSSPFNLVEVVENSPKWTRSILNAPGRDVTVEFGSRLSRDDVTTVVGIKTSDSTWSTRFKQYSYSNEVGPITGHRTWSMGDLDKERHRLPVRWLSSTPIL